MFDGYFGTFDGYFRQRRGAARAGAAAQAHHSLLTRPRPDGSSKHNLFFEKFIFNFLKNVVATTDTRRRPGHVFSRPAVRDQVRILEFI